MFNLINHSCSTWSIHPIISLYHFWWIYKFLNKICPFFASKRKLQKIMEFDQVFFFYINETTCTHKNTQNMTQNYFILKVHWEWNGNMTNVVLEIWVEFQYLQLVRKWSQSMKWRWNYHCWSVTQANQVFNGGQKKEWDLSFVYNKFFCQLLRNKRLLCEYVLLQGIVGTLLLVFQTMKRIKINKIYRCVHEKVCPVFYTRGMKIDNRHNQCAPSGVKLRRYFLRRLTLGLARAAAAWTLKRVACVCLSLLLSLGAWK